MAVSIWYGEDFRAIMLTAAGLWWWCMQLAAQPKNEGIRKDLQFCSRTTTHLLCHRVLCLNAYLTFHISSSGIIGSRTCLSVGTTVQGHEFWNLPAIFIILSKAYSTSWHIRETLQTREGMKKCNFYLLENASHLGTPKQIDTFIASLFKWVEYLYYTTWV